MAANTRGRMVTALNYIQDDVLLEDEQDRCCILFQEVDHDAYRALCEHKWVRDKFVILPEDEELPHSYNVVTLVSKAIPVLRVQSLHFGNSTMGRSALLVDITLSVGKSSRSSWRKESSAVTCRIANTHLESLPTGVFARPYQLAAISSLLYQPGIHCGVVCGDMNTILPDDEDIHARAALADAWYGSSEEEGYTWGYQPACQFPPGRLDRVFYTHNRRCMVRSPKRIGMGLRTARGHWVSDHYGLLTTVSVL
ncbi:Endonuclease/exonuclease/phosphatase [Abortiporus biennis]|nr:Endonuclease/exonuclease/phosphatase [Abortiporus biennis]